MSASLKIYQFLNHIFCILWGPFRLNTSVGNRATPQIRIRVFSALHRYAPHNDFSVNDGPLLRRLSHNIIILQYHCFTVAYSIQYSNMLYRFLAQEKQAIPYRLGVQQATLSSLNEVIPFCINSIYLLYCIIPSTQHKSLSLPLHFST